MDDDVHHNRVVAIAEARTCGAQEGVLGMDGASEGGTKHRRTRTGARDALTAMQRGASVWKRGRRGRSKAVVLRLSADEQKLLYYSRKQKRTRGVMVVHVKEVWMGGDKPWQNRNRNRACTIVLQDDVEGRDAFRVVFRDEGECAFWSLGLHALVQKWKEKDAKSANETETETTARILGDLVAFGGDGSAAARPVGGLKGVDARHVACGEGAALLADARGRAHALARLPGARPRRAALGGAAAAAAYCAYRAAAATDTRGALHVWNGISAMLEGWTPLRTPLSPHARVSKVSLGSFHVAAITEDATLYTWGEGIFGALGHGDNKSRTLPQPVESLKGMKARAVSCGAWHTAVVIDRPSTRKVGDPDTESTTGSGAELEGGDLRGLRRRLQQAFLMQVRQAHTSLQEGKREREEGSKEGNMQGTEVRSTHGVTWEQGVLYTFGDGAYGQLGHGNKERAWVPLQVQALRGQVVAHVGCGERHTCAAVCSPVRKVFSWGDGSLGCLGQGAKICGKMLVPKEINRLRSMRVLQLACGPHHNAAIVLPSGKQWGSGGKSISGEKIEGLSAEWEKMPGKNGNEAEMSTSDPDGKAKIAPAVRRRVTPGNSTPRLPPPVESGTVDTEYGRDSSSEPGGALWMWGCGKEGRLGLGNTANVYTPAAVLQGRRVLQVSCGSSFTAAVVVHRLDEGSAKNRCRCCARSFTVQRKMKTCQSCGSQCCKDCLGDLHGESQEYFARRTGMLRGPQVCKSCAHRLQIAEEEAALRAKQIANRSGERRELSKSKVIIGPGRFNADAIASPALLKDAEKSPPPFYEARTPKSPPYPHSEQPHTVDLPVASEKDGRLSNRSSPTLIASSIDDQQPGRYLGDTMQHNASTVWYDAEDRFVRWQPT